MLRKHKVCLIGLSFAFFILLLSSATLGANTPVTSFSDTELTQPESAHSLAQLPPPPGMVSYWEFNEGGGMIAHDSIGRNDGTLWYGGIWVPGIAGTGVDLYPQALVECGGDPSLSIQQLLTIEAWVMLPDTQGVRPIVQNGNDIMSKMYHFGIEDGVPYFDRYDGSTSPANMARSGLRVNAGTWHHVAVLMELLDPYTQQVTFYVNGTRDTPIMINDPYNGLPYSRFNIGYGQNPMAGHSSVFFNGLIDEVAVYDELLSEDYIQQHFQSGKIGLGYLDGGIQEPLEAVDDSFTAHEDVMLSVAAPGVLLNDIGDGLTAVLESGPSSGTLSFYGDGSFQYTSFPDSNGVDTFTYSVTDGFTVSNIATVTITVNPVNDAPVGVDDSYAIDEDTPLDLVAPGILENDSDIDGDSLIAVLVDAPLHGSVALNADGSLNYVPDADWYGTDYFTYQAFDGTDYSDIVTVSIEVSAVGDAPRAQDDFYITDENVPLIIDALSGVLVNDTDPDDDVLASQIVTYPSHGLLDFNVDGSFTYTPNPDWYGVDTFVYQVMDGMLLDTATVTITVIPVNRPPVAVDDLYTTNEDFILNIDVVDGVLANDTDENGDALTAILVSGPSHGLLVLNPDGSFIYTPNPDWYGVDSFGYEVSDGELTDIGIVTITVNPVNDYPVALDDTYVMDEDGVLVVDSATGVLANDYDVDGDALEAYWLELPTNGDLIFNLDGSFTYTPNPDFWGIDSFTYLVYDGIDASEFATVTITVNAVQDAPVAVDDFYSIDEDTALSTYGAGIAGVLANDYDADGDPLEAVLVDYPVYGTISFDPDGNFLYVPEANFYGIDSFTYYLSDGVFTSNAAMVTITVNSVNDYPVAVDDMYVVDEDDVLVVDSATGVLANDYDIEGNALEAYWLELPTNGDLHFNLDGSFTYTPNPNFWGTDFFTYLIYDGIDASEFATVTITVNAVNDAPIADDDDYSTNEDTPLIVPVPGVLNGDTDVENDPLTTALITGPVHGVLILNSDGSFDYIPDANFFGTDTFTYVASDGALESNVATVTIEIVPINDAPVASDDFYTTDEDTLLSTYGAGLEGVLGNDYDVDGDLLEVYLVQDATYGYLALDWEGNFEYMPYPDFFGIDTFTYYVYDGSDSSSVVMVTIEVLPINDAPVAHEDEYQMDEDGVLSIPTPGLLINDYDVDGDVIFVDDWSDPTHGILWVYEDGSFEFIPDPDWNGVATFEYWVFDGLAHSNVVTVTIFVNPVNDAPVAVDDFYSTDEDTELSTYGAGIAAILVNDYDADGDPLEIHILDYPAGTLISDIHGDFVYIPNPDFWGTDLFTYYLSDGVLDSNIATVTIIVNSVNDAPVAHEDEYQMDEDGVLSIPTPGLLINDYDVDGDVIFVDDWSDPTSGSLMVYEDGSFEFIPDSDWNGVATFEYWVFDGFLHSNVVTVTIYVLPVDDPPVAVDDYVTTDEDTPITIDVLANDYDIDGDSFDLIDYYWSPAEPRGELTLVDVGGIPMIQYTPDSNWHGSAWFTYNIGTTGSSQTVLAYVYITVNSVEDAPVAVDDAYLIDEDGVLQVDAASGVLANDYDGDGDSLTLQPISNPSHGSLSLNPDGSFTYTPDPNWNGMDSFIYEISDGDQTDTATVTITVNPVDDLPVAVDDYVTTDEDTPITIDVLANDYDIEGDSFDLIGYGWSPAELHGELTLVDVGGIPMIRYTPDLNWHGSAWFTYNIGTTGSSQTDMAYVYITVNPVNDAPIGVDDEYTIDEDGSLSVPAPGVLANDYDVDGDSLSAILVSAPYGSGSFSVNGALTYIPPANWHGVTTLTYRVFDGTEYSDIVTVTITVNSVNDAPVGVDDEYTIDEDTPLILVAPGLLANDYDVDGDTITLVVVTAPSHGSGSIGADGSLSYTPDANWYGTDGMTYQVFDGKDYSGIVTVTITVDPVNDAPVGVDDEYTIDEDGSLSVPAPGVLANDYDVDGDSLSAILVSAPYGSGSFSVNGALTYNPPANWHGVTTLTYQVFDGTDYSAIVTVTITVNSVNDAPVGVDDEYTIDEDTSLHLVAPGLLANDYDVDGDTITLVVVTVPSHGSGSIGADGSFSYTPDADWYGTDGMTYQVFDGTDYSGIVTVTITVNPVNDAPVGVDDEYIIDEDGSLSVPAPGVLVNDYDVDGDSLSAILVSPPYGSGSFSPNGALTYNPPANWHGVTTLTYQVFDGTEYSDIVTVTITVNSVNDAPVGVDDEYTIDEDTSLHLVAPGLLANDYDVDGDAITLVVVTVPSHGSGSISADGSFSYTPHADWYGTDGMTYKVFDGTDYSDIVTVTIIVNSVNDVPVAVDDYVVTNEDTPILIDFMGNDYDVDDSFGWDYVVWAPTEINGELEIVYDHEVEPGVFRDVLRYTPNPDWYGSISTINYRISDTFGAQSSIARIYITVNPVNDAPVAVDDYVTTNEDTSVIIDFMGNDYDVDNSFTFDYASWSTLGIHGELEFLSNYEIEPGIFRLVVRYTPDPDWHGTASAITYGIKDSDGLTSTAQIFITVNSVNDPPVAVDDYVVTDEDTPVIIDFMANDYDIDSSFDWYTITRYLSELHGTSEILHNYEVSPGVFRTVISYTPDPNWHGSTSAIYYDIWDSEGAVSETAYIHITVNSVNDPPVGVDDSYTIDEDTSLELAAPGLLANDYDVDGDIITLDFQTYPQHGTWAIGSNGFFNYYPPANWHGTDSFTYRVFDGTTYSEIVTVTVTVNPVNDAPVAVDDYITTDEDTSVIIDFMANDYDIDSSFDWYTITRYLSELHGTADILHNYEVSPGVFRTVISYTPDPNWHGSTSAIYYDIRDSEGAVSATAYIHITVNSVNDAPVGVDDSYTIDEDTSLVLPAPGVLANDYDVDGDAISLDFQTYPQHGTWAIGSNGFFNYYPPANWYGTDSFTYRVYDGTEYSEVVTVTIIVNPVNDPPVAVDDYVVTDEDTPVIIDFMGNDYDVDSDFDKKVVSWYPLEIHGQWEYVWHEVEPGVFRWTIKYTPDPDWHGAITPLQYQVMDSEGAYSNTAYIHITVNPVNDAPVASDDNYVVDEDTTLTIDAPNGILANDTDIDGDLFTATLLSGTSHGSLAINPDGSFIYTPDPNWNGMDSFIYEISDGDQTDTATVTITVNPVDDPPVAVDDYVTTDEDTPIIIDVMANDYDVDGDPFDIFAYGYSYAEIHGQLSLVTVDGRRMFRFVPDPNYHGPAKFHYTIHTTGVTGSIPIDNGNVYITVNPVNDAPVGVDDSYTIDEDTSLNLPAPGVLANDYDVDGDAITLDFQTYPQHGDWVIGSNGLFNYYPFADWYGTDSFTYRVYDGTEYSGVVTVTVTVNPVNDGPVAEDDDYTTDEDVVLVVDAASGVLANDADVDGDALSVQIVSGVSHGHLVFNADGSFTYTPDFNWYGVDSFVYEVSDGSLTDTATTTIKVDPVNDAPVAVDDAYTTDEDTILLIDEPSGVLANDYDIEGSALIAGVASGPSHGTLSLNPDGSYSYTSYADWFGVDSFVYEVSDGMLTDTATVTITVNSVNDVPVAVNDTYSTLEDITLIAVAPGVLANDFDIDGDSLVTVLIDLPLHGIVLLEPDGAFTYIPNPDYYGFDTFTYLAFDGTEYSDKAFVIIEVIYVNTPPTAYDDAYTTEAGVSLIVDAPGVLANDIDVDEEDILEAILIASPMHGMVVLSPNGWFNYAPDAAWCGVDTFTYYVFDGREYSNIAVVTITVIDVKPPVTTIQFTGVEGEHGWYHSDVEVTLTATDDASGVASTVYSLDGSTWIPYSGPFVLTNSGEVTVYYYSTDNAGNVEDIKSATIKICKPTRSFVTGGGWIYDSGGKGHFTFVVKYKCNVLKGHLIYSFRADGYKYIVKSTHFFGMAIDENHALLEGKAKILRYNYETRKWQCFGNFYFRVEIWDNGKCKRDIFQIRIFDESGELFHEAGFDPLGKVHHGSIQIHERGPRCWCKWWGKKKGP